jgi:hypothetical protein
VLQHFPNKISSCRNTHPSFSPPAFMGQVRMVITLEFITATATIYAINCRLEHSAQLLALQLSSDELLFLLSPLLQYPPPLSSPKVRSWRIFSMICPKMSKIPDIFIIFIILFFFSHTFILFYQSSEPGRSIFWLHTNYFLFGIYIFIYCGNVENSRYLWEMSKIPDILFSCHIQENVSKIE